MVLGSVKFVITIILPGGGRMPCSEIKCPR